MATFVKGNSSEIQAVPGTFSIVGSDPDNDSFGVAISTALVGVGATCPHVSANGALSVQSFGRADHGQLAIDMVDRGLSLPTAITAILEDDDLAGYRQWHGIDVHQETFTHTGSECVEWSGSITERDHTVAGNMLSNSEVIESMSSTFQSTTGRLSQRLISALESGQSAGGDKRGKISAALLVHSPEPKIYQNIRIDYAENPVQSLRDTYELGVETEENLATDVGELLGEYPEEILQFGLKY